MRSTYIGIVLVCAFVLTGCAKRHPSAGKRLGIKTAGLISKTEAGTAYLYDANGQKRYRVTTDDNFSLPYEQCVEVQGRTDHSTSPPTLEVRGYESISCR